MQSLDLNPFGDYIRQYTSNHFRNVSQDSELNFHKNDIILVPKHRIRSVMPKRHYGILEENSKKDEVLKHFLRSSVTKSFSVSDKFPPILIDWINVQIQCYIKEKKMFILDEKFQWNCYFSIGKFNY